MGICGSSHKAIKPISEPIHYINDSTSNLLHFSRSANLRIRLVDPINHRVLEDTHLKVALTEPVVAFSQQVPMDSRYLWASGCILPGLDPRGGDKPCQDMVLIESFQGVLLTAEFDGHGAEGQSVVNHCRSFTVSYLKAHIERAAADPKHFLIELNEACDKTMGAAVNCIASGCTAVMMLVVKGEMYFSCVGDSRAMLATDAPPSIPSASQPPRGDDKTLLAGIKVRRSVTPDQLFCAVQMTQDQKPEDPGELSRIREAGGVVMRLEDDNGRRVGPYRVWKVEGMYPGIAMSRSLGDIRAHEIGLISTPTVTSHIETQGMDYFVVLASDGVWDVMENQEVCDFVEAYRHKSLRNVSMPKFQDTVLPDTVTIAQLLCEEARARWLSVVEAEDVLIDDISCVILELQILGERKRHAPNRTLASPRETQDVPGLEKTIRRVTEKMRDPKRDPVSPSMKPEEIAKIGLDAGVDRVTGAVIKDPRRSSVSLISIS